jgi:predicted nucleic acid-binding protein
MKIIIDTCVWSACLRKKHPDPVLSNDITDIIKDGRVCMMGCIRQEILSGISVETQFENIRKILSSFKDIALTEEHYVLAAVYYNTCRKNGIQGAHTDFLICAAAAIENFQIFTTDRDFSNYKKHLPIHLWS